MDPPHAATDLLLPARPGIKALDAPHFETVIALGIGLRMSRRDRAMASN